MAQAVWASTDQTRFLTYSLIWWTKRGCGCFMLSSDHIFIFLLCYTPTCDTPIHSFSPSCSRLTVTVSSPLITVPLSHNCRSKKLSSCLSLGSTLGGKLEHYIKTMWARLVCGCVCVCAHAELCLHLFVCIPLHEVKRLLQNVNDDRESGLHVNNSENNMNIYNHGHLFSRSSIYILRVILFFIVFLMSVSSYQHSVSSK